MRPLADHRLTSWYSCSVSMSLTAARGGEYGLLDMALPHVFPDVVLLPRRRDLRQPDIRRKLSRSCRPLLKVVHGSAARTRVDGRAGFVCAPRLPSRAVRCNLAVSPSREIHHVPAAYLRGNPRFDR